MLKLIKALEVCN